jgi:hypothetical protein
MGNWLARPTNTCLHNTTSTFRNFAISFVVRDPATTCITALRRSEIISRDYIRRKSKINKRHEPYIVSYRIVHTIPSLLVVLTGGSARRRNRMTVSHASMILCQAQASRRVSYPASSSQPLGIGVGQYTVLRSVLRPVTRAFASSVRRDNLHGCGHRNAMFVL